MREEREEIRGWSVVQKAAITCDNVVTTFAFGFVPFDTRGKRGKRRKKRRKSFSIPSVLGRSWGSWCSNNCCPASSWVLASEILCGCVLISLQVAEEFYPKDDRDARTN